MSARLPITNIPQQSTTTPQASVLTALNALPESHVPANSLQSLKQHQQQQQQHEQKPSIKHVINQIDGVNDIDSSDDDDEDIIPTSHGGLSPDGFDDDDDEEVDNFISKADEANDEGKEDSDPLNSSDDVSEHDPNEIFDVDNVIICQYEKLTRIKTRWKFHLKDGVMNINGKDYLFAKATGEADWL